MKRAIYVLCILLDASISAQAHRYGTPEGVFANGLAQNASFFAMEHEGRAPSSWADIFNGTIDAAYWYITPTKRYAFLSQPLHLPPPHEGDLLIITRRPFRDSSPYGLFGTGLREPGRYIIYRTSTGEFTSAYVDEAYVQRAFRGFESLLPTPDTEPMRRHEVEARDESIVIWCMAGIAVVFLVLFFRRSTTRPNNDRNA